MTIVGGFERRVPEVDEAAGPEAPPTPTRTFLDEVPMPAAPAATASIPAPATPPDPTALYAWIDLDHVAQAAPPMPTSLDPNKPRRPRSGPPMAKLDDLAAQTSRRDAERLLTGNHQSPDTARRAMQLLTGLPEAVRGHAIDQLDEAAFDALLDQIPHDERAGFTLLLAGTTNPARKLKLWAEAHKARGRNDARRLEGDTGYRDADIEDELAQLTRDPDEGEDADEDEEEEEVAYEDDEPERPKRTKAQKRNLKRHRERVTAIVDMHAEVDRERKALLGEGKELMLADVDEMIERKELEYAIERNYDLNLTGNDRDFGDEHFHGGVWETEQLKQLQATLGRLPEEHVRGDNGFTTINRLKTEHIGQMIGGFQRDREINMLDAASWKLNKRPHAGDRREHVSEELRQELGDTVTPFELTLTHEIGHDVAAHHQKAFAAFQRAGGWRAVDLEALKKDGVPPEQIEKLDKRVAISRDAPAAQSATRWYSPNTDRGSPGYWAQDKTATPAPLPPKDKTGQRNLAKAESMPDDNNGETWNYAKSNPREHFAEVYMKAVHTPEKLYADLVTLPREASRRAHEEVARLETDLQALDRAGGDSSRVAAIQRKLSDAKQREALASRAAQQRGEQFRIMRDDVFDTDRAASQAVGRLQLAGISGPRLAAFEEAAAGVSTPDQIAALERQYKP